MYCTFCGGRISDGARFCEHCGARQDRPERSGAPAEQGAAPAGAGRRPRRGRRALVVLAVAAAALVGARLALGALFGPQRAMERFLTALQDRDAAAFRGAVTVPGLTLTDEAVEALFNAYGGEAAALRRTLLEDAAALARGTAPGGERTVRLTERSGGLLPIYAVEIVPAAVVFRSEFDGARVQVDGRETAAGREGGAPLLLLPGSYCVTAWYTSPDTGAALHARLEGCAVGPGESAVDVRFPDCVYASIVGGVQGLTLEEIQVDGRTYAGDLGGADLSAGLSIGPVKPDSKIRVTARVLGLPFVREYDLAADGLRCCLARELSAEMREEAADIAARAAADWMRAVFSYDRIALKRMGDSGAVSDGLLAALDDRITAAWNSVGEVSYIRFDSIAYGGGAEAAGADVGGLCAAYVAVPLSVSGGSGTMSLATGSFAEDTALEIVAERCGVHLVYEEGRWAVSAIELV